MTRFVINRQTYRVNYTVEGYGQIIKGSAAAGTTPLRVMIQFLADYAPSDLEDISAHLAELESRCNSVCEWELSPEDGISRELGPMKLISNTSLNGKTPSQKQAAFSHAEMERTQKLEELKNQIGYGKYALNQGKSQ